MKTYEFTPGPWQVGNADDTARDHAVCAGPVVIAKVTGNGYPCGKGWSPDSAANARAIAALPDLVAALSLVKELATNGLDHAHPRNGATMSAIAYASSAALAKLEG